MATEKKYVSLSKLGLYDEKIKKYLTDADTAALDSAKLYADGLAVNYDAAGSAATVQGKLDAEVTRAKAREDEIAAANVATQGEVDALETYVGTIPEDATATDIVGYVQEKTAGIATDSALNELAGRVTQAETDIDNIEKDYLKAADKTELSGLITAEQTRATGVEAGLRTDVDAIKGDYLKAADKDELQGDIDTNAEAIAAVKADVDAFFADADMTANAKDTLKELQEYIASDESGAAAMAASIQQNSNAISAVEGRMTTAEGKITTAEGKITANETAITALQGADTALSGRIDVLESAIGESGSVADDIATAKQEAIEAAAADATTKANQALADAKKYADDEDAKIETRVSALETASGTHALKSELDTLAGRVTTAEGEIDTLQTEMDAVEALAAANKSAHEANAAAIALKAAQTDLDAAVGRIAANEAAIASFVEVSEAEVLALFTA